MRFYKVVLIKECKEDDMHFVYLKHTFCEVQITNKTSLLSSEIYSYMLLARFHVAQT